MSANANKLPVISLSEGFGVLVVQGPNIEVGIFEDGNVVVRTGMVKAKPSVPATLSSTASTEALKVGDVMPEGHENAGWIYGGISDTTLEPFYIASKDSGVMQWQEAMAFAACSNASVPSREDLHQMYKARNEGSLKGTFNSTGSYPAGWYWSSSQVNKYHAWAQRFSDGFQNLNHKGGASSLRCVRR